MPAYIMANFKTAKYHIVLYAFNLPFLFFVLIFIF